MKNFFFKIVIPSAAILLAIGGSFTTHASQKKATVPVPGYFTPLGSGGGPACQLSITCTTIPGPLCTVIFQGRNYAALGKVNPSDTTCPVIVYTRPAR